MARMEFGSSDSPLITVESVHGSLQVRGWDEEQVRIDVRSEKDVQVNNTPDSVTLSASNDCVLRVPNGSNLIVEDVTRDVYIQNVEGDVHINNVSGSLTLRNTGDTKADNVSGDLTARNIEGSLRAEEVSGNTTVRNVDGDLHALAVHGNLSLRNIEGDVTANVDGNADLRLDTDSGDVRVEAGGNVFCKLTDSGDADVQLESGGNSIHLNTDKGKSHIEASRHQLTLGDGGREIHLKAMGLVDFRSRGGEEMEDLDIDFDLDLDLIEANAGLAGEITEQVTAQIDAQMENVNQQLRDLQNRLRDTTHRATRRAQRRIDEAQRRLQSRVVVRNARGPVVVQPKKAAPISEQERMMILQMVQDKKISVAQAEMLLNTIEGRQAPTAPSAPQAPTPPAPPAAPEAPQAPDLPEDRDA